jgi:hypothetical protein
MSRMGSDLRGRRWTRRRWKWPQGILAPIRAVGHQPIGTTRRQRSAKAPSVVVRWPAPVAGNTPLERGHGDVDGAAERTRAASGGAGRNDIEGGRLQPGHPRGRIRREAGSERCALRAAR